MDTMRPKYRVEAFIIPRIINEDQLSTSNEMEDVKIANSKLKLGASLKSSESVIHESKPAIATSDEIMSNIEPEEKLISDINDTNEPIYDVPCILRSKFSNFPSHCKHDDTGLTLPPKIPVRTSSLMSIDERGETDGIIEEFCFHGYKNGCTVSIQRPEQVSEDIFQDNWLRRLERLREREATLGEKETILQERERLLFKKERELRILERLVREKLKQADLRLKLCESSHSIESTNFDAKTRSSEGSQKSQEQRLKVERSLSSNLTIKSATSRSEHDERLNARDNETECEKISRLVGNGENFEKGNLKNPPNSRSSLWTTGSSNFIIAAREKFPKAHGEFAKNSFPAFSGYGSLRTAKPKIRPKISYDDLDSTLSADIGDSSYVVTSRKFDPTAFKKPHAFTRSSSERRTRQELHQDSTKDSHHVKYPQHSGFQRNPPDDKILKRTGENILIGQQNDNVKYQDYGLIDERIVGANKINDEAKNSYMNLEKGTETMRSERNLRGCSRERPNSWNEETNEWLRKKRHAYNMATMRMSTENFENKENADSVNGDREKLKKITKKKDSRTKKFGIFR